MMILLTFFINAAWANPQPTVRPGTYSAATESDATSSFQLKANGTAIVTPRFEEDASGKNLPAKKIAGTWKAVPGGIELSYGKITDHFVLEAQCRQWPEYYCLRYKNTPQGGKTKLEITNPPFINWDWKYKGPNVTHHLSKKCVAECEKLQKNGELKKGMSIQTCGDAMCEDAGD